MTVNLQALAIKSKLKVAMRYKNFKAVAMRCKNKGKPRDVTKDNALFYKKFLSICFCGGTNLLVRFFCLDCTNSSYR